MSKVSNQLSLNIGSEFSLKDFSFSQLIVAVKNLMDTEGVPGLIKAMIILVEMLLIKSGVSCPHCESEKYHLHSKSERTLKTTIGKVRLALSRFQCLGCGRTYCPLNKLMDIDPYSRKSRELEKLSLETVTNQSFRRSAGHLADTLGFATAHTTLHRWFQNTDATNINLKKKVDSLAADGTGFKREKDENGSNRGEVRVIIGYNRSDEVIPFGAWIRASWKDIGKLLKSKNHASEKVKFKPIAGTLVTDGEEELINALK